nr:DUF881 domain-containing protein [Bacillus coahuilensis]
MFLSLVFLVLGFILSFSYNLTNQQKISEPTSSLQFKEEDSLRNQINDQKESNLELQEKLYALQNELKDYETELSKKEDVYFNLVEDVNKYRMFLGEVDVKGPGLTVKLEDGAYDPKEDNVNNYLVHEHHVFKVINELYIAGATAISINGKRISADSYIVCNGPVITVDGEQFPAPFVISAIGDSEVLESAINITGGVKDQIVNDNIIFSIEKINQMVMESVINEI